MPTGFGFAFGGISFVLLVMAIGYGNNLLYFFVFLLISMALVGMWLTNKNVDSFQINDILASNIFAQQENQLEVQMQNINLNSFVWDIKINVFDKKKETEFSIVDEVQIFNKAYLTWKPVQRGLQNSPRLMIESRFPFGMFRAWKYFDKKRQLIVYPERKGKKTIPLGEGNPSDNDLHSHANMYGLFRDFREFQKTDTPSRIDWKRSLKHQKHFVKNFEASKEKKVLIDWDLTNNLSNFEDRVSQLALWVDLCHKNNEFYSLKIKNDQSEYSNRPIHYKTCMEKLALLQIDKTL